MAKPLVGIQLHPLDPEMIGDLQGKLGCQYAIAPAWWGAIERTDGVRDWSMVSWWDQLAEHWEGPLPHRLWTLYVVHMNDVGELPEDLQGVALDDDVLLGRFDDYVEALANRVDFTLQVDPVVVIGNEVDLLKGAHPEIADQFLAALPEFTASVRRHIPNARIANSVTFDSASREDGRVLYETLRKQSDVVAFTFYDWDENRETVSLSDLSAIVTEMVDLADGKPLVIKEIGLATGPALQSSEKQQAARVAEMVEVLESYDRDTLLGAIWLGLDDWDPVQVRAFITEQFPERDDEVFYQFLTTLGIRTFEGEPKQAWDVWTDRVVAYAKRHPA